MSEDLITRLKAAIDWRRAERMAELLVQVAVKSRDRDRWHDEAEAAFVRSPEGKFDAAHRKILELHGPLNGHVAYGECVTCHGAYVTWPCPTLLATAEAYGIEVES